MSLVATLVITSRRHSFAPIGFALLYCLAGENISEKLFIFFEILPIFLPKFVGKTQLPFTMNFTNGVNVSVETTCESKIQEIAYDGTEIYET